jgi:predicted amidohydrolase YtcJ
VTRVGPHGEQPPPWMLSQLMTVEEALRSLTVDAAFAQGTEDSVGSIEVGKDADFVILSADPTTVAPSELADIDIVATIVDGRVEYCGKSIPTDLEPSCPSTKNL